MAPHEHLEMSKEPCRALRGQAEPAGLWQLQNEWLLTERSSPESSVSAKRTANNNALTRKATCTFSETERSIHTDSALAFIH